MTRSKLCGPLLPVPSGGAVVQGPCLVMVSWLLVVPPSLRVASLLPGSWTERSCRGGPRPIGDRERNIIPHDWKPEKLPLNCSWGYQTPFYLGKPEVAKRRQRATQAAAVKQ